MFSTSHAYAEPQGLFSIFQVPNYYLGSSLNTGPKLTQVFVLNGRLNSPVNFQAKSKKEKPNQITP